MIRKRWGSFGATALLLAIGMASPSEAQYVLDGVTGDCEGRLGGQWIAETLTCTVPNVVLFSTESLEVANETTLEVDGHLINEGTIHNEGEIRIGGGITNQRSLVSIGSIWNYGSLVNWGNADVYGPLHNDGLVGDFGGWVLSGGMLANSGDFVNRGFLRVCSMLLQGNSIQNPLGDLIYQWCEIGPAFDITDGRDCPSLGGAWDSASETCRLEGVDLTIGARPPGLYIDGQPLAPPSGAVFRLYVNAKVLIAEDSSLSNSGSIEGEAVGELTNLGTFRNEASGYLGMKRFENGGPFGERSTFVNLGLLDVDWLSNFGDLTNFADLGNFYASSFVNEGSVFNWGDISSSEGVHNLWQLTLCGDRATISNVIGSPANTSDYDCDGIDDSIDTCLRSPNTGSEGAALLQGTVYASRFLNATIFSFRNQVREFRQAAQVAYGQFDGTWHVEGTQRLGVVDAWGETSSPPEGSLKFFVFRPDCPLAPGSWSSGGSSEAAGRDNCNGSLLCLPEVSCGDDHDNDSDGLVDCQDADCADSPFCSPEADCHDDLDNDYDGLTDCADPDCAEAPACLPETTCNDALDNDFDGLVDCLDADCHESLFCIPETECDDGLDNDQDGDTDCLDVDCSGVPLCPDGAGGTGPLWLRPNRSDEDARLVVKNDRGNPFVLELASPQAATIGTAFQVRGPGGGIVGLSPSPPYNFPEGGSTIEVVVAASLPGNYEIDFGGHGSYFMVTAPDRPLVFNGFDFVSYGPISGEPLNGDYYFWVPPGQTSISFVAEVLDLESAEYVEYEIRDGNGQLRLADACGGTSSPHPESCVQHTLLTLPGHSGKMWRLAFTHTGDFIPRIGGGGPWLSNAADAWFDPDR